MLFRFIRRLTAETTDAPHVGTDNPLPTTPLRKLGQPKNIPVTTASAKVSLTGTTTVVSLAMVGCNARIKVSAAPGADAVVTDHRIMDGERIEIAVDAGSAIAAIAESGSGTLAISELL